MSTQRVPIEQLTDDEIERTAADHEVKGDMVHARELRQFREGRTSGNLPPETVRHLTGRRVWSARTGHVEVWTTANQPVQRRGRPDA